MREREFLQLYDDDHMALYRFAYRMTGSAADAEDVVQECFLELLRPGCAYDRSRTPLRTYLFGVARRQSLKRISRRAEEVTEIAGGSSPEGLLQRAEIEDAVGEAVRRLPEGQREALILAHYEQMSLAEIASVMEIEVTAVKSRLQRARAGLKEALAAYAPGLERKR